jgi:hypothetical protein
MSKVRLQTSDIVEFDPGQVVGGIGRGTIVTGADLDAATELDASYGRDFLDRLFESRDKCVASVAR